MPSAKVPVLDLGNVVIQVDWAPFAAYLIDNAGPMPMEEAMRFSRSSLFYEFEFGQLSPGDFFRRMSLLYKTKFHELDFFDAFCAIFPGVVPGMAQKLQELSETTTGVYCLSNTNRVHLSFLESRYEELKLFRKIFASHEMQRRKPFPGIYRELARQLDCPPHSVVFFDDLSSNIEGARQAGLKAYLFKEASDIDSFFEGD